MGDAGKRLVFLDSLRGFAALFVVAFHSYLVPAIQKPALPTWLSPAVFYGSSGVILFFVISAFSLSLTMPRHEANGGLTSYYLSRLFRIAPLSQLIVNRCRGCSSTFRVGILLAPRRSRPRINS